MIIGLKIDIYLVKVQYPGALVKVLGGSVSRVMVLRGGGRSVSKGFALGVGWYRDWEMCMKEISIGVRSGGHQ